MKLISKQDMENFVDQISLKNSEVFTKSRGIWCKLCTKSAASPNKIY